MTEYRTIVIRKIHVRLIGLTVSLVGLTTMPKHLCHVFVISQKRIKWLTFNANVNKHSRTLTVDIHRR